MSQSPLSDDPEDGALRYRQGWRALNRMLHENRSFSGNERHCAFLNCGPDAKGRLQAFADVSHAVGFDFSDDGRGIALADWDFDGDLDVWTTSRTAPRIRFLRNNSHHQARGHHFIALQLRGNGTSTNRDAIGARVAVHLAGQSAPRIRTLHAGQSFLSQSTRWLHFGLGASDTIDKVVIQWPAGGRQELAGLKVDQHYLVTQGSPRPAPFTPPAGRGALTASEPVLPPPTQSARIIVPPGMPLPPLTVLDANGQAGPLPRQGSGLLLVNLWSAWCLPCQAELRDWTHSADAFRKAGIEVVALHAEGGGDREAELGKAREVIAAARFPFPWFPTPPVTTRSLDFLHAACLDLWTPLPVPSSVLVDAKGEVLAIYVGPVEASRIVADSKLATATPEIRRDAAVPFPGRWVGPPASADANRIASQMVDGGDTALAVDYLSRLITSPAPQADPPADRKLLGDRRFMLGLLLEDQLRLDAAGSQFEAARQLIPGDVRIQAAINRIIARMRDADGTTAQFRDAIKSEPGNLMLREELGMLQFRWGRSAEAVENLTAVVDRQARNASARYHLALALLDAGQPAAAVDHLKRTLTVNPRFLDAANQLGWVLATHPSPSIRAPGEAHALASRLCAMTKDQNPQYLETLACAQAAKGDFAQAAETARKALAAYGDAPAASARVDALTLRLQLFEARKPFIEQRWSTP